MPNADTASFTFTGTAPFILRYQAKGLLYNSLGLKGIETLGEVK